MQLKQLSLGMILVAAVMVPRAEAQAGQEGNGGVAVVLFEKPGDLDQVLRLQPTKKKSQLDPIAGVDLSQTTVELF